MRIGIGIAVILILVNGAFLGIGEYRIRANERNMLDNMKAIERLTETINQQTITIRAQSLSIDCLLIQQDMIVAATRSSWGQAYAMFRTEKLLNCQ